MLARGATAEVAAGEQDPGARVGRVVELEVRVLAPVEEEPVLPAGALDPLEELLGNDLVGVDVRAVENRHAAGRANERLHATGSSAWSSSRTSTKWPAMAAAAAISGLTRCVRPPRPWRPSKLRFEVDAHRSPGLRVSGFMPRHIEQPASR